MKSALTSIFAPWIARFKALAALPISAVTWGLVIIFSVWIVLDLTYLKVSSGVSQTTYDAMVKHRLHAAPPDPRLVIVDIDEASLARMAKEFGRWPWPRDTLASVQDFLEREGVAAIVWDIAFTDADRLSPGGDAAFNESAKRSPHSHYSVIRLPSTNDSKSQLTRADLPTLWVQGGKGAGAGKPATLAAIVPVLPSVAAGKLGFNNGYPDEDGVLRRYRYSETLADGSVIQSTPLSAVSDVSKALQAPLLALPPSLDKQGVDTGTLIVWRKHADAYPKISFADVFERAEGGKPKADVPSFKGKVVVVGSTAPSLHDIHPTPLVSYQAGVESLATVIDNGLNERFLTEIARWLQALIAITLCVALAFWVRRFGIASLDGALVILPGALLGISYLSLNFLPIFLDLQLAASAVLIFLAALRAWNNFRRNHWCALSPTQADQPYAVMPIQHSHDAPFADTGLDRLIDWLEVAAPACRIIGGDATSSWPAKLRWPELASRAGIAGPINQLTHLQTCLPEGITASGPTPVAGELTKANVVHTFFRSYL
ncbi:MAG: CHASE2 domain-containing protein [Cytophagales bacterium]|nr:CHASE2 domain-containing protein [Cytophagales bacterium]